MLIIPIRTPLVNVLGNIVKPEAVRRAPANSFGCVQPALRVMRLILRMLVAPRVEPGLESAARGSFPFGFGGKPIGLIGFS